MEGLVTKDTKVILPGGAGLVGQNLAVRLVEQGHTDIVVIDKHRKNLLRLKQILPEVSVIEADLALPGEWQHQFVGAGVVVMLQAQIGGLNYRDFVRNNVESTKLVIETIKAEGSARLVHVSSSVVESMTEDFYTVTKKEQEKIVLESGLDTPILRPTLMFGWFDRKHLGWLSRFMQRVPIFPIPGNGRFMRQPLYVGDFCNIIISCIKKERKGGIYNISGQEKVDYIDIIYAIKSVIGSKAVVVRIPYTVFYVLLFLWGVFDKNPPFTVQQLTALSAHDEFELIDWPRIFNVPATKFEDAINETFNDARYSNVILDF